MKSPLASPRLARALGWGLALALLSGCGGRPRHQDFVPPQEAARKALEAALTAWQNGQLPGKIDGTSPAVQAVDSVWQAGQKLAGFTILEAEPGEGPQRFSVRLSLKNVPGESVVHYLVLGRDPLWVYRAEDYQRALGM